MDLKAIIKFERMWGKYRKEILDEKERRRAAWERRRKEQEELGEDDEL